MCGADPFIVILTIPVDGFDSNGSRSPISTSMIEVIV